MESVGAKASPVAGHAPVRPDVFVSYSRRDKAFVESTLFPALVGREKDVWIDLEDIPPASDWRERVLSGVAAANAMVFVLSPDSLASPVCAEELARAVALNKRIIPVLRRDADGVVLPEALSRANWVYLRDEDDRERGITLMLEALETDLPWRDAHSRLAVRAAEWLAGERDRGFLLRGSDLSNAENWLARQDEHTERATPDQASYIIASRHATARRQRITSIAVLAALVVAIVLAAYALIQRGAAEERARVASSRELAARALAVLTRDPELAVLLAAEGARKRSTDEAEDALRRALGESHVALTLRGHSGPVDQAVFTGRDRFVVTAGHDSTVRVWNARTGRSLSLLRGHKGVIRGLAVSHDASRIVSTGEDRTARVWERATGRAGPVLRGHAKTVHSPSFSPDGRLVLTASLDGTARLWDARTGRGRAVLKGHDGTVFSARFDAGARRVLTAGTDGTARLWSVRSGRPVAVLRGHRGSVNGASFSPDGALVATAGHDSARVWNAATGRQLEVLPVGDNVTSVAFAPDSARLATTSGDGSGAVWRARTGTRVAELRGHEDTTSRAAFSPDGDLVTTTSDDDTARVWDSASGEQVAVLRGHTDNLGTPRVSRDGARILTASDDGTARIWRMPQHPAPLARDAASLSGAVGLTGAVLSPDGSLVLTHGSSGSVRVFDARSRELLRSFGIPQFVSADAAFLPSGRVAVAIAARSGEAAQVVDARGGRVLTTMRGGSSTRTISVSRDGSRAATVALPPDNAVRVWDTRSGRIVSSFVGRGLLGSATLTPDGSRVIVMAISGGTIEAWDVTRARGRLVAKLNEAPGPRSSASFSPDGRRAIVTTLQGPVPVWDMRSTKPDRLLRPRAQAYLDQTVSVDWSPRGDLAAVADLNKRGVVRIFGVARGDLRTELRHGTELRRVAFSRDGRWLVSAGVNPTARVWDVSSGRMVAELRGHSDKLVAASFGPDARQVVTASEDRTARVHECEVCASLRELLKLVPHRVSAGRQLTELERQTYLHESG